MAKKRAEQKSILKKYTQQFLSFFLPLIVENKEDLIKKFGDIVNFKKMFKRYMILLIITIVALFIIVDGLGLFISSFFPDLRAGVIHISIGVILILAVLIYNRFGKP
jgi:hypothetical protein